MHITQSNTKCREGYTNLLAICSALYFLKIDRHNIENCYKKCAQYKLMYFHSHSPLLKYTVLTSGWALRIDSRTLGSNLYVDMELNRWRRAELINARSMSSSEYNDNLVPGSLNSKRLTSIM